MGLLALLKNSWFGGGGGGGGAEGCPTPPHPFILLNCAFLCIFITFIFIDFYHTKDM